MGVAEAPAQMLHQGLCSGHVVVKGNRLVQDRPVTGLPQIGGGARNEPERVIVEAAAHVAVALFGQGLVLVVGTAVLKLGGSNVQNAFPCAGRDHVDEAQQILTGIPEPHAAADAALVIAGTAAHGQAVKEKTHMCQARISIRGGIAFCLTLLRKRMLKAKKDSSAVCGLRLHTERSG